MLLIVGLDGATLDLIEPWVAAGELPHLARLMETGTWGRLASTIPPVTFPSWTTFTTGVQPGRHGIFDFSRRDPGSYRVRFVNSTFRKAPTVWRMLSDAGKRVAVLGIPGTYPPEPINGCMVCGFDTPVTTRAESGFMYPPELEDDVKAAGGFPFADFQEFRIDAGWHARALGSLLDGIDKKERLARRLLRRERWDCFMLMFGESDTVAHHFWSVHDPGSPRFDPDLQAALGDPIREVYAALDAALGRLCEESGAEDVLVASDHGFGGTGDTALSLNRWLHEQGLLAFRERRATAPLWGRARAAALGLVPPRLQARLFRLGGGRISAMVESGVRFAGIDWESTRAFSEELNYAPSIWLNVEGREPAGCVPADRYDALCEEIREALRTWSDPATDQPVVRAVWRRDEIYDGPHVARAPDLVIDLETPGGYSYVGLPSGGKPGPSLQRLSREELRSGGKLRGMSGSHRRDGMFALAGSRAPRLPRSAASIADMTPTILALLGVPVPENLDGQLLPGLAEPGERGPAIADAEGVERAYEGSDERWIREQLERLGYLE